MLSIVWSWTTWFWKTQRLWDIANRWVTTPIAQDVEVWQEEMLDKW